MYVATYIHVLTYINSYACVTYVATYVQIRTNTYIGRKFNAYQGFFRDFSQGGSKRGITGYWGGNVV